MFVHRPLDSITPLAGGLAILHVWSVGDIDTQSHGRSLKGKATGNRLIFDGHGTVYKPTKILPLRRWHLASLRGQSPYQLILGQLERWPSWQVVQNTYILQWASQSFIGPSDTQVCKHNYHNRRVITIMSGGFHHFQINGAPEPEPERHFINEMFQCFWDCYAPGLHCNDLFYGHNLSHHLRERHGIHGPDNARVFCQWRSCNTEVNKESLARHIEEKHMKVVHPCGVCGKLFSRGDTLNRHRREKQH